MNIPGMQASGAHEDAAECEYNWLQARDLAVISAEKMLALGLHKQIAGRILEPWMWTIVCTSGTEWSNFRSLRDHPAAEPHIQILAQEIGRELDREDNIQVLQPGQWHLPFVSDHEELSEYAAANDKLPIDQGKTLLEQMVAKSVACCASTSYKTVDGFDMTLEKAIELHDKLVGSTPLHASPAEHVAQADRRYDKKWQHSYQHGNFQGFRQYRKMLPNECL